MEQDSLEYGSLVRVRNLAQAKHFYTDVLCLGEPILNSNFWLEYQVSKHGLLVLEQSQMTNGNASPDVSVLIFVENLQEKVALLENNGLTILKPSDEIPGFPCASVKDPEGNIVTFYQRAKV
ncbi:MAG: VOC family protein [Lentisphaeria bacterium]|nr:VOC family protein [Lentisphaeria bacterium]